MMSTHARRSFKQTLRSHEKLALSTAQRFSVTKSRRWTDILIQNDLQDKLKVRVQTACSEMEQIGKFDYGENRNPSCQQPLLIIIDWTTSFWISATSEHLDLITQDRGKEGRSVNDWNEADDLLKCIQQNCREQVVLFWRVLKFAVVVNREGRLQQTVEQIAGLIEAEKLRVARNHIQWFQTVC